MKTERIEELRQVLNQRLEMTELDEKVVLDLSQKLDKLILEYYTCKPIEKEHKKVSIMCCY